MGRKIRNRPPLRLNPLVVVGGDAGAVARFVTILPIEKTPTAVVEDAAGGIMIVVVVVVAGEGMNTEYHLILGLAGKAP